MYLKSVFFWILGTLLYFIWFGQFVGLRNEHIFLWFISVCAWWVSPTSKRWFLAGSVWLLYWMVYDSLRIIPNWMVNTVHIEDLYQFDKKWFGVHTDAGLLSLNEWCTLHAKPSLDLLGGLFYASWVPFPILLAIWFYMKRPELYWRFSWTFFFVNLIGFAIYYLYPAAPPWYVAENGFVFNPDLPRSAAGLDRVDKILNIHLFETIYTRNSNVFAAMPSLHSAYPLVAWIFAAKAGKKWLSFLFAVVSTGIWLTAIYSNHHYVLDVVAGISVAACGYFLFDKWIYPKTLLGQKLQLIFKKIFPQEH